MGVILRAAGWSGAVLSEATVMVLWLGLTGKALVRRFKAMPKKGSLSANLRKILSYGNKKITKSRLCKMPWSQAPFLSRSITRSTPVQFIIARENYAPSHERSICHCTGEVSAVVLWCNPPLHERGIHHRTREVRIVAREKYLLKAANAAQAS
jgi:hypothetical protein